MIGSEYRLRGAHAPGAIRSPGYVRSALIQRCNAAATTPTKTERKPLPSLADLPVEMRNSVAVLDAPNGQGGSTKVYVVGVSHVSQRACEQIKDLVRAVEPEVVMVELCRDRLGLLVSTDLVTQAAGIWHCRKVYVDGIPNKDENPEFPTGDELRPLLLTQPGRPITTQDIETDVFTLLSTGLFKSVKPMCQNPSSDESPEFGVRFSPADGSAVVKCIPPLGAVRYQTTERLLPPIMTCKARVDSSLMEFPHDEDMLKEICQSVVADSLAGQPSLRVLLRAKARFADLFFGGCVVSYANVESGRVEVVLKASKEGDRPYVSGLESSAEAGEGWGIDLFRPQRPMHRVSDKMFLTAELLDRMRESDEKEMDSSRQKGPQVSKKREGHASPTSTFRIWSTEEVAAAKRPDLGPVRPLEGNFINAMTLLYAKYQAAAGRKVGIEKGAAWQAALQAASEVGTQQFVLSDRPIAITDVRLQETMGSESGTRVAAALTALIGAITTAGIVNAPQEFEIAGVGAVVALAAGLLWPVLAPFAEIGKLAEMSKDEIESVLLPKSSIATGDLSTAKLFGEDALLDWPGAMVPLLHDRDEYMAKATAAAAKGLGFSPAFILDEANGQLLWRYMMADNAPPEASPSGFGDGAYTPLSAPRAIVNVVGTAHVPGMVRNWEKAVQAPEDVMTLLKAPDSPTGSSVTGSIDSSSSSSSQ